MKDKRASHPQSIMNRKHPSSVTHSPFPYCSLPSTNTLPSYPFHTSPSPHTGILLCPLPLHPILTQHHSHHNIAIPTKAHNKTDPKKDTYKRIRKKKSKNSPLFPARATQNSQDEQTDHRAYSWPKPIVSSTAMVSFCCSVSRFLYGGRSSRLKLCHVSSPYQIPKLKRKSKRKGGLGLRRRRKSLGKKKHTRCAPLANSPDHPPSQS